MTKFNTIHSPSSIKKKKLFQKYQFWLFGYFLSFIKKKLIKSITYSSGVSSPKGIGSPGKIPVFLRRGHFVVQGYPNKLFPVLTVCAR